jgi:acetyl esterase/lipase
LLATVATCTGQAPQNAVPAGDRRLLDAPQDEIALWENGAPGALGTEDSDTPTLTIYRATRAATGTGVVVAPGGGYSRLAIDHEGRQVAAWFNAMGVSAYVLKYRLGPRYHHPIQLGDAQRAIRLVRSRAQEFGLAVNQIGMMGFSAGGHLAAMAGTHFDEGRRDATEPIERVSSQPDFLILGYPVISFDPAIAHAGSVTSLLGDAPDRQLIDAMSADLHVTAKTPPTFIFHTTTDATVPVENAVRFYLALRKAGVSAEMHIFASGPHGVGLALGDASLSVWPTLLSNWIRARGLLARPPA